MKYVVRIGNDEHEVFADSIEKVDGGLICKVGETIVADFAVYDSVRSVHEKAPLNYGPAVKEAERRFALRMEKVRSRQRRLRGGK